MRVILLQDVKSVGRKGESVEVSDGYGANYLIPRRLAVPETARSVQVLNKQRQDEENALTDARKIAEEIAKRLDEVTLEFTARMGADQKMFGSISSKQIEQELKSKYGVVIDKRRFIDKFPVNTIGFTRLRIELFKDVIGIVNIRVIGKE